jgi:hypothetical protein
MVSRTGRAVTTLAGDDLALPDDGPVETETRALDPAVEALRLRFLDAARDYQVGALVVRRETGQGTRDADAPIVLAASEAEAVARRMLAADEAARRTRILRLSPSAALRLEAGDRVAVDGVTWRVQRLDLDERPRATLVPVLADQGVSGGLDWAPGPAARTARAAGALRAGPAVGRFALGRRPAPGRGGRRAVAAARHPRRRRAGDPDRPREGRHGPATLGVTLTDLPPASPHRLDHGREPDGADGGRTPWPPRRLAAVLASENALAIQRVLGRLGGAGLHGRQPGRAGYVWTLTGLLRGQRDGMATETMIPNWRACGHCWARRWSR